MNFYQQKYFQPYRKVKREPLPGTENQSFEQPSSPQRHYYDSPVRREDYSGGPTFERSPSKANIPPRMTTEPIWEYLYNEGRRNREEIMERHNLNKNKIDIECTFQPILKQNKRYLVHSSSNFLERNTLWNEQKIEKKVKEKEEQVYSDLRECTFTPKINAKVRKQDGLNSRSQLRQDKSQRQLRERNRNLNPYYSPIRETRKASPSPISYKHQKPSVEMPEVYRLIKNELRRLNI